MSDSIWNDPRITAYVLDELSEDERQAFELELEGNSESAAAVAEARNVTGRLEGLFAAESTRALDEERRQAIVADGNSATATKATVAPGSEQSWRTAMIVLATAASLLVLVGGPMLISRNAEMVLGQAETESNAIAADQSLQEYGAKAAEGAALEGLDRLDSNADVTSESRRAVEWSTIDVEESAPVPNIVLGGEVRRNISNDSLSRDRASGQKAKGLSLGKQLDGVRANPAPVRKEARRSRRYEPGRESGLGGLGGAQPAPAPESAIANGPGLIEAEQESDEVVNDSFGFQSAAGRTVKAEMEAEPKKSASRVNNERYRNFRTENAQLGQPPSDLAMLPAELREQARPVVAFELPQIDAEFGDADDDGRGAGIGGDKFEPITDNPFRRVAEHAMSTFSVDVDTASYSKTRDFLARANQLPRPDAVRIEELINYFDYDYEPPTADDEHPFTTHTVVTSCPWNKEHRLARIALKGKVIEKNERPKCNLVFLLDTSGSMNAPNKLPLVIEGMQMLLNQLQKKDRVAITVYAGSAGLVLESTPAKKKGKGKIRKALTQLNSGGNTNGGAGIALAYQTARDNFIEDGVNRVILCTDGDFNVGTTGTDALVRMVEKEAKGGIFLSVLGFGMGNHNDSMLEQISGRGNGNYAFIDNQNEAHKVLVEQTNSTLVTIAKDVKLQIEFNPTKVSSYRLIGYENRVLAKEDFNDDKKDAGEIGAGHAVTALYEIVPVGVEADESRQKVDDLKYQSKPKPTDAADSDEIMTLKLRYKAPDGDTSTLVEFPVTDDGGSFADADKDIRFTAAVAGFGMQLRRSEYKGSWTLSDVRRIAASSKGEDENGLRTEFVELVQKASELMGEE